MNTGKKNRSWYWYTQWGRRLEAGPTRRRVNRQVWFCTWCMGRTACLFRTVPVAQTGAAQLRVDGVSICCYLINVHIYYTTIRQNLHHARKAWPGTLVDTCLLSGYSRRTVLSVPIWKGLGHQINIIFWSPKKLNQYFLYLRKGIWNFCPLLWKHLLILKIVPRAA